MTVSYRIGVAGLGTVGASVVRMIARRHDTLTASGLDIRVAAVSSRDRTRDRGLDLAGVTWFDDPVALARSGEVDCVVELIGGAEGSAKAVVEAALQAGKTVVTANKALLARHGAALAALAEANGV
ncbi:homoserine dehydrogenase, partial [Methylobacterium sp. WL18]